VKFEVLQILFPKVTLGLAPGRFNHRRREVGAKGVGDANPFTVQHRNQMQKIHPSSATEFQDTNAMFPSLPRQEIKRIEVDRLIVVFEKVIDPEAGRGFRVL
jgi:hypothetical protein